ncbi:MAG: hypothetical protein HY423_02140 [Candidatus Lambdaproteobacteria bacterium]|nr:hypothetical protein [Candidatus Lambdaproteobacteria bacterium]
MPTMQVHNPTGATEIERVHAPRLDTLAGKTIAFLSNDSWQAHRTLPLVMKLLQARYPTAKFLPPSTFPTGNVNIDKDETVAMAVAQGADAAVIGNAA